MKIAVLMSTYNGEKYIRQQLESILKQTIPAHVFIRDDGSSDTTTDIIDEYIAAGADIELIKGQNLGVKRSFFELIKNAPDADYYAFADQDDVWMPDKLEAAVKQLKVVEQLGLQAPLLYCADTYLVDADLKLIVRENKNPRPSFGNALVENICTGCTAVINRILLEKIREHTPNPDDIVMHDWWLYLIAEAYGKTIFDREPHMNYRQHGNNEWGVKTTSWAIAKHRIKQMFSKRGQIYRQLHALEEYLKNDSAINDEYYNQLKMVLDSEHSLINRVKLVVRSDIYMNDKSRDRVYRFKILTGKL